MRIQDVAKKFPPFDKSAGEAAYLIQTGKFAAVEQAPKPAPNLQWQAQQGRFIQDYECPPLVIFSCSTCGAKGYTESQTGTAHKTTVVRHCGVVETCPDDVAAVYSRVFSQWKAKSKKLPKETVSSESPAHQVRAFGLRTKQELIQDQRLELAVRR